jgi:6-phosphogluconolactonase
MQSISRRRFLTSSAALPYAWRALAAPQQSAARAVLFGTGADGIYRAAWNSASGELGRPELAVATDHPTFLAQHPIIPVLYSANELPTGDGSVCSFSLDVARAELKLLDTVTAKAPGTCFVSVDHTGGAAFSAQYAGGSLTAYHLTEKGVLSEAADFFDCRNNPSCGELGPVKPNQQSAHLHCAVIAPDNKYVLACNLGEDAIEVFPISPRSSNPLGTPMRVDARAGSGPRHLAFHPNKRWLYCIHELDCTVDLYDWRTVHGNASMVLRDDSAVPLLPAGATLQGNSGCELSVSPDGKFLYANTRGQNWMVVFAIDHATGLLNEIQRVNTGGDVTRHFAFDPSRRWLLCANQGSSTVSVQAHDPATGRLSGKPRSYPVNIPMFVHVL